QTERGDTDFGRVEIERRIALAIRAVETNAPLLVFSEAAAEIGVVPDLRVADVGRRQTRQRLVAGALRNHVDRAASARGAAAEQRARALEDFDAFDSLKEAPARVGEVEQPVISGVEVGHRKSADEERVALTERRRVV